MARSLAGDFGIAAQWLETESTDTQENASRSAGLLRRENIGSVLLVSHGWHLPRAVAAFERSGVFAAPFPVRPPQLIADGWAAWLPRSQQLHESWLSIRELVGSIVYSLRHRWHLNGVPHDG
jgi:uncharacterized SAM-binding protein YcdF (DUF218 family)